MVRPYALSVRGEAGKAIATNAANLAGEIPANGTRVIDLSTVLRGFTAAPRGTINVSIAGPDRDIQGLYQIVQPAAGGVSNHVMVRPETN